MVLRLTEHHFDLYGQTQIQAVNSQIRSYVAVLSPFAQVKKAPLTLMCDPRHYGLKISATASPGQPNTKARRGAAVYQKQQLHAASQHYPGDANHCVISAFDRRRHAERDVGSRDPSAHTGAANEEDGAQNETPLLLTGVFPIRSAAW